MIDFHFLIGGYGFGLQVNYFDFCMNSRTILGWSLVAKRKIWRGERHIIYDSRGYEYCCFKSGKEVERFSIQSPIVNMTRG